MITYIPAPLGEEQSRLLSSQAEPKCIMNHLLRALCWQVALSCCWGGTGPMQDRDIVYDWSKLNIVPYVFSHLFDQEDNAEMRTK